MSKKEHILLLWIFTISACFLLVLYSPLGSPDFYRPSQYFALNQGVSFSGRIQNASKSTKSFPVTKDAISSLTKDVELSDYKLNTEVVGGADIKAQDPTSGNAIPIYTNRPKSSNAVPTIISNGGHTNQSTYSVNGQSPSPIHRGGAQGASMGRSLVNSSNNSQGGSGGGIASNFSTIGSTNRSSNNNQPPTVAGFATISIDISMFTDTINNGFFANDNPIQKGGSGPDGGTEEEEPIPVGDGWWLLLLFAAVYAKFKTNGFFVKSHRAE